jgi:hypothetical protein
MVCGPPASHCTDPLVGRGPAPGGLSRRLRRHRRSRLRCGRQSRPLDQGSPASGRARRVGGAATALHCALSTEWIDSTTRTGRFGELGWSRTIEIDLTTLDRLIAEHGRPKFAKIDVEGYERQVLAGLSTPIDTVLLEFAQESIDAIIACLQHLESIRQVTVNYSMGQEYRLRLPHWVGFAEAVALLHDMRGKPLSWGDLLVRMTAMG